MLLKKQLRAHTKDSSLGLLHVTFASVYILGWDISQVLPEPKGLLHALLDLLKLFFHLDLTFFI